MTFFAILILDLVSNDTNIPWWVHAIAGAFASLEVFSNISLRKK